MEHQRSSQSSCLLDAGCLEISSHPKSNTDNTIHDIIGWRTRRCNRVLQVRDKVTGLCFGMQAWFDLVDFE